MHFKINKYFLENLAINEVIYKNNVELDRRHMTVWCMHIARRIPKTTNTRSEYVMLIAFQLHQL
jgi:hypothetical protein